MADTLTTTLRLTEPTVGGDSGTWGTLLNNDLVYIDEAINQTVTVNVADTNVSLTSDGSSSDQARYLQYNITGAWTADRTITLPGNAKVGWVINNTSGGHNVILSAGGTTLSVYPGATMLFACDGTNVAPLFPGWQELGTFTASAASSLAFPLPTVFRRFRVTLQQITVSSNGATSSLQFSSNGGSTYLTASSYAYSATIVDQTATTSAVGSSTGATSILIGTGINSTGVGDGEFTIWPGNASLGTRVLGRFFAPNGSNAYQTYNFGGGWTGTSALMNFARIQPSAGTFSGSLILEGLL